MHHANIAHLAALEMSILAPSCRMLQDSKTDAKSKHQDSNSSSRRDSMKAEATAEAHAFKQESLLLKGQSSAA